MITGAFAGLFGNFTKKAFAQSNGQLTQRPTLPSQTTALEKNLISQIAAASLIRRLDSSVILKRSQELKATAEEVDAALDAIEDRLLRLTSTKANPSDSAVPSDDASSDATSSLTPNSSVQLTSVEQEAAKNLITGFEQQVQANQINRSALRQKDEETIAFPVNSLTKQVCSNGRICWKFKWWGVRIRLNHCAVEWISNGGSIASLAAPPMVKAAIAAVVGILKLFDTGCGVQIKVPWVFTIWLFPKSCSKCQ